MENLQPQKKQDEKPVTRLGFYEIVPGSDHDESLDTDQNSHIPEFNLRHQLLADQRRETSARRQGPGARKGPTHEEAQVESFEPSPQEAVHVESKPREDRVSAYQHPLIQWHAIVEDIVRRDIRRLCMGPQT